MKNISKYRKALAAAGSAVVAVAAVFGLKLDPAVVSTVEGVIATVLVYVLPNG